MSVPPDWAAPLWEHPLRKAILEAARDVDCYLVGGAIRDLRWLGRSDRDWDLLCDTAEATAGRLAGALGGRALHLGGRRFQLFRVVSSAGSLDLQAPLESTLRGELARRDLTINAVALDLRRGSLEDPLDGLGDVERRVLRHSSPRVFAEDPLRVLRLLRFAATLPEASIEAGTSVAARASVEQIQTVASERIREELRKIYSASPRELEGEDAGRLAARLALFPTLWLRTPTPGEEAAHGTEPDLKRLDACLERALVGAGRPSGFAAADVEARALEALRHAALLHCALNGRATDRTSRFLRERGFLSKRAARRIDHLLAALDVTAPTAPSTTAGRRAWLARSGEDWPLVAALALWRRPGSWRPADLEALAAQALALGSTLTTGRGPLTGDVLRRELGLAEGPRLGRVLGALRDAWLAGDVDGQDEALAWAERWLERETGDQETGAQETGVRETDARKTGTPEARGSAPDKPAPERPGS